MYDILEDLDLPTPTKDLYKLIRSALTRNFKIITEHDPSYAELKDRKQFMRYLKDKYQYKLSRSTGQINSRLLFLKTSVEKKKEGSSSLFLESFKEKRKGSESKKLMKVSVVSVQEPLIQDMQSFDWEQKCRMKSSTKGIKLCQKRRMFENKQKFRSSKIINTYQLFKEFKKKKHLLKLS